MPVTSRYFFSESSMPIKGASYMSGIYKKKTNKYITSSVSVLGTYLVYFSK